MSSITKEDIRSVGGIVHSDGNIFFTNSDQLNSLLAKLAQQEPVAWWYMRDVEQGISFSPDRDPNKDWQPLYTHPAPQQADRQRVPDWRPIETAPKDGRLMLLGYVNRAGNWRTLRGKWCSAQEIADEWGDDEAPEGWYEVSVECESDTSCWATTPTHWMPLPAAPGAAAPEAPAGAVVQKAVAWVPVHPKSGPLWAMTTDSPDPERLPAYPLRALYYNLYDALTASPEAPAQADAFNPFAGHSIAVTKQTAYGEATAYFPELPEASAVDERAAGVFSEFNACMHRETCRAALAQKGGAA